MGSVQWGGAGIVQNATMLAAQCTQQVRRWQRSVRSRLSNETYRKHAPAAESESAYASAESGSDSGHDSTDEAGMVGPEGSGAEGAVFDRALVPFLSEDFTEVVKGWRPNVGAAAAEYREFGEPPIFWILKVLPVSSGSDNGDHIDANDRSEVDAIGFRFKQSKEAVMSQKAQRRMVRQTKAETMWAGPAVVCEQRTERRVPIGHVHRGSGVRKVMFADSGEDSSDGNGNGSGSEVEGGCSRAKNRARQRSLIIRQDTAGVKRRAAAKAV